MEKLIGRGRFTNDRVRLVRDTDETPEENEKREAEERRRDEAKPSCDCAEALTPIQQFQDASDRRWGVGRYRRGSADVAAALPATVTPLEKFIAASNARHGIRR